MFESGRSLSTLHAQTPVVKGRAPVVHGARTIVPAPATKHIRAQARMGPATADATDRTRRWCRRGSAHVGQQMPTLGHVGDTLVTVIVDTVFVLMQMRVEVGGELWMNTIQFHETSKG